MKIKIALSFVTLFFSFVAIFSGLWILEAISEILVFDNSFNWWSRRHMQKYVNEFVFRYNYRKCLAFDRFELFLNNVYNKITYKELIHG